MNLTVGSICSGYGGLDMAVRRVFGARVAWNCDNDARARRILTHHHPDLPLYGDLTQLDWSDIEPPSILTAGYPCQPFSAAGKRLGTSDERHIWPHIAEAVRVLRPWVCIFENVAGHLSMGIGDVLGDLASLGYDTRWGCVRASDVGAPHHRKRVFIVAVDAGRQPGPEGRGERSADAAGEWSCGEPGGRRGLPADASDDGRSISISSRLREEFSGVASGVPAADAGGGRHGGAEGNGEWPGATREQGRPGAPERGATADTEGHPGRLDHRDYCALERFDWLQYAGAVRRWHDAFGCVPAPTQPSSRGGRPQLAPAFAEWMMGVPRGHVTDPAIWQGMTHPAARKAQLHALGNGVCPPQAEAAIRWLISDHPALGVAA